MINSLTKKQEKELIKFRDECLKIGLSTEPIKRDQSEHRVMVDYIYKNYLKLDSPIIWYVDSPLMLNLIINFVFPNLGDNLRDNLGANLRVNLGANLRANLQANLRDNLGANLLDNLRINLVANLWANLETNLLDNLEANLRSNLEDNLGANLWANLEDNLLDNLRDNLRANLEYNLEDNLEADLKNGLKNFQTVYYGNTDIYWLSFYLFPMRYLGINYKDFETTSLNHLENLCKKIGWIWYFKNICFISDRPIEIHKNGIHLHADEKPALLFKDGYCLWYLNGVRMEKWMVMTPAEEIDPKKVLEVKNAEQRRELLRKIGVERFIQKITHKVLNTVGDYSLIEFKFNNIRMKFLKMKNPSIGVWHVEGVRRDCNTVTDALHFRKPKALKNIPISENGEDWYQQGDVCIWRDGAKSVKKYPSVLT